MRKTKMTKYEKLIEESLGQYVPTTKAEFNELAKAIAARRKDSVLNIRMNRQDLDHIKQKANKLGIKYQTFIAELLHKVAEV
jgi:predicted DNA binding CopG/RHH family protein